MKNKKNRENQQEQNIVFLNGTDNCLGRLNRKKMETNQKHHKLELLIYTMGIKKDK